MQQWIAILFSHERRALADALRRDACREATRAGTDAVWTDWHMHNARLSRRLLYLIESFERHH